VSRRAVVAIVWGWIVLVTAAHFGERSPYSYGWAMFDHDSARMSGAVVNPDAIGIAGVTRFFYDATPPEWSKPEAENLRLPLHSFSAAVAASFTRSLLPANVLVNVLFAMLLALAAVNLAERFAVDRTVTLFALLTFFSLPLYADYLGQPLHYIVGTSVSFLVVLSLIDETNPWVVALAIAVLSLNYDPYVFIAAIVVAFANRRLAVAAIPAVLWALALRVITEGTMTTHLRKWFFLPVLSGWTDFLMDPVGRILLPFVATHVGVVVAFHQLLAMVYWPLLAVCAFMFWRLRPELGRFKMIALLPLFFLLEQLVAAAFDWELNPRRAVPAVLAFGISYVYVAGHMRRAAVIALFVLSAFLAFADTLFDQPGLAFLRTGQAIRHDIHDAMRAEKLRLDTDSMPRLMHDQQLVWGDMPAARVRNAGVFAVTQAFALLLLMSVFWLAARAKLLPRWLPYVAAGVWLASLVRFV
jgi:hypothetical protein